MRVNSLLAFRPSEAFKENKCLGPSKCLQLLNAPQIDSPPFPWLSLQATSPPLCRSIRQGRVAALVPSFSPSQAVALDEGEEEAWEEGTAIFLLPSLPWPQTTCPSSEQG